LRFLSDAARAPAAFFALVRALRPGVLRFGALRGKSAPRHDHLSRAGRASGGVPSQNKAKLSHPHATVCEGGTVRRDAAAEPLPLNGRARRDCGADAMPRPWTWPESF